MSDKAVVPMKGALIENGDDMNNVTQDSSLLLPDVPDGSVTWKHDPRTNAWTLVRVDQQHEKDIYKLEPAVAWNPNTGREQMIVRPVLKKKARNGDNDDDTVATADSVGEVNDNLQNDKIEDIELKDMSKDDATDELTPKKPAPVLGRDYVIHTVLPSDTFSGLCLRYKIKAVTLRRINQFSGTNLALAPSQLVIPLTTDLSNIRIQDVTSKEYKLQVLVSDFPQLTILERKAYLEMNDWNLEATTKQVQEDNNWEEKQVEQERRLEAKLKSLEIQYKNDKLK